VNTIDKLELPTRLKKKDKKYKKKSVALQQGMSFPASSGLFNAIFTVQNYSIPAPNAIEHSFDNNNKRHVPVKNGSNYPSSLTQTNFFSSVVNKIKEPIQEELDPEDPDVKDMFNGFKILSYKSK
jgi:hypothetical protein